MENPLKEAIKRRRGKHIDALIVKEESAHDEPLAREETGEHDFGALVHKPSLKRDSAEHEMDGPEHPDKSEGEHGSEEADKGGLNVKMSDLAPDVRDRGRRGLGRADVMEKAGPYGEEEEVEHATGSDGEEHDVHPIHAELMDGHGMGKLHKKAMEHMAKKKGMKHNSDGY